MQPILPLALLVRGEKAVPGIQARDILRYESLEGLDEVLQLIYGIGLRDAGGGEGRGGVGCVGRRRAILLGLGL